MQWHYSDYPTPRGLVAGHIEIELTAPPVLSVVKVGPNADPVTIPSPLRSARWRVSSDVQDDLKRFVRGRYWAKIETALLANYLRELGMKEQASVYDRLAGLSPQ